MSILNLTDRDGGVRFDADECRAAGLARTSEYQAAGPFPHAVLDDFISPDTLRPLLADFPGIDLHNSAFDRSQERLKFSFHPDAVGPRMRSLLMELNGEEFIGFLEALTGIDGLIPDPYFYGGGLHETRSGGHLSVHADFNIHPKMKVERRLNLLIYLNENWSTEYGGNLELWDKHMTRSEVSVAPTLGRAVVFNTTLESFHGQPDPVTCPPDRSRRSIATYYYTAVEDGLSAVPKRTTTFQVRPGTGDKVDRRIKLDHWMRDWVPPRLYHRVSKLNRFK